MKSYIDRLREVSIETIKSMIDRQKKEIEIMQRDLKTMEQVLVEKTKNQCKKCDRW